MPVRGLLRLPSQFPGEDPHGFTLIREEEIGALSVIAAENNGLPRYSIGITARQGWCMYYKEFKTAEELKAAVKNMENFT